MSRLTDLIAQAKAKDPQLGADLDREFKVLSERLPFGLNFERHRPEAVELPQRGEPPGARRSPRRAGWLSRTKNLKWAAQAFALCDSC